MMGRWNLRTRALEAPSKIPPPPSLDAHLGHIYPSRWLGIPPWDGSMVENQSTRSRLSNRLSFAFRSRSPSGGSSASSTPVGSPMGSPVASHNNLEALGAALEGLENTSAPPQALKVAL
mmetsp:Transcript_47180/g.93974  ORF Transcript_47180/g.93974 Transcript_47180/m.93974 type:complete len:119 (-) Transcript_47180:178-534(-)